MGSFVTMGLSAKRQSFCRYIAIDSLNPTEAYIKSFNVTSERKHTATEAASRLMKLATIQQHIQTLQADISDKLASEIVWDRNRIVSELAVNVELAREHKQMAASNRSLELVAKITGSLSEDTKQVTGTVSVTHSLSDAVLDQLASMATPEPVTIDDTGTIEASYKLLEAEPE